MKNRMSGLVLLVLLSSSLCGCSDDPEQPGKQDQDNVDKYIEMALDSANTGDKNTSLCSLINARMFGRRTSEIEKAMEGRPASPDNMSIVDSEGKITKEGQDWWQLLERWKMHTRFDTLKGRVTIDDATNNQEAAILMDRELVSDGRMGEMSVDEGKVKLFIFARPNTLRHRVRIT